MEQSKKIAVSLIAAHYYQLAQGGEMNASIAMAFDTIGFDKAQGIAYNQDAADRLDLSLKTMQNRAVAAKAINKKYGPKIAAYADGLTCENVSEFHTFLVHEMTLAGAYRSSVDDMLNFMSGAKPAHVQRKEVAEAAEATKKALLEKAALLKAEQEAEAAKKQADMSGTPDAPKDAPQDEPVLEGTEVGEQPADAPVKHDTVQPLVPSKPAQTALVSAVLNAEGVVIVDISDECASDTLSAIIQHLQAKHKAMIKGEKAALKAAA